MSTYSVHHLPVEDRPRERLKKYGAEAMSTAELLAIILGSGTRGISILQLAHDIMARFESPQQLAEATVEELAQIKGLGPAKALQIKAAVGLGIRTCKAHQPPKYRVDNPAHAYNLIKDELRGEKREIFLVILLDTKGCSLGHHLVSIGTLSSALIHPREVFHPAIRHKAASLILIHNHPSGDPTPSKEDCETTKILVDAGNLISIPVNDHIIIGENSYISMRQRNDAYFNIQ